MLKHIPIPHWTLKAAQNLAPRCANSQAKAKNPGITDLDSKLHAQVMSTLRRGDEHAGDIAACQIHQPRR